MRKRERENPCGVCGHYHKYEEGEVCGICGHRMPAARDRSSLQVSAFPTEIFPDLYLGSYDNASRVELLKTLGISCILNTVPTCQNLYKNSFTYHCLPEDQKLPFDDAIQFLEQCGKNRACVLVHCMFGKNRSPAIVIAFLMKSKGWTLAQSYQWVKDRRPSVELTPVMHQQLLEFEQKLFGSVENSSPPLSTFTPAGPPSFTFGFPNPTEQASVPAFNSGVATSVFSRTALDVPSREFAFGSGQTDNSNTSQSLPGLDVPNPNSNDIPMGGS